MRKSSLQSTKVDCPHLPLVNCLPSSLVEQSMEQDQDGMPPCLLQSSCVRWCSAMCDHVQQPRPSHLASSSLQIITRSPSPDIIIDNLSTSKDPDEPRITV